MTDDRTRHFAATRRGLGRLALGLAAAPLAAPAVFGQTAPSQIRRGDELVVGIWGGIQETITREMIARPLEERYGVRVNFVLGGTPERRARAIAERGRPSFDVIYQNIFESRELQDAGVTQPWQNNFENASKMYELARVSGYGVALNALNIVYDKTRITTPITSWADLWRDDLRGKGRLIWAPWNAIGLSALLAATRINGGNEDNINPGFQAVARLRPFAAVQSAQEQLWNFMEQNVGDVSIEFRSFSTLRRDRVNPNVEVVQPREGQPVGMNFACIPVGARNQRLAEEWINLHLSVAVQTRYAQEIYFGPTNSEVRLPPELASRVISSAAEVQTLMSFDIPKINQRVQQWSARYNREIVGS
jgi:putative spermidine/putrescine transport system substrate-binding protein